MIRINSNGSKHYGEAPDSIDRLIEVLGHNTLDPRFLNCGRFIIPLGGGAVRFFGNFFALSHVFNIDTDEPEIIGRLTAAICDNMATKEFQGLAGRVERVRDTAFRLLEFAQDQVAAWGEIIDSDQEISGADAVDYLGGLVHDARRVVSKATKGDPLPFVAGERLLEAAKLVEAWWLREEMRLVPGTATGVFGGEPAGMFALRQAITDAEACPGMEIEPGVFSGCTAGGGDCPACGR